MNRDQILDALSAWINQRPGLEFGNYGDVGAYRSEMRRITRQLHDARTLLSAVRWRESIGVDALRSALSHLRTARDALAVAQCPNASEAVRRAIKSTEGALRNQLNRNANLGRKVIKIAKGKSKRVRSAPVVHPIPFPIAGEDYDCETGAA